MQTEILLLKNWVNKIKENEKLYLYGAGGLGNILANFMERENLLWDGILDGNPDKEGTLFFGKKIENVQYVLGNPNYYVIICIFETDISRKIFNVLEKNGFNKKNILVLAEQPYLYDIVEYMSDFEKYTKYTKKVLSFRNKYKGKRAFIIGNGPSLTVHDLNKVKNEITFACNSIVNAYDKTSWRPTFYFACDGGILQAKYNTEENIRKVAKDSQAFFSYAWRPETFFYRDKIENLNFIYGCPIWHKYSFLKRCQLDDSLEERMKVFERIYKEKPFFSEECEKKVFSIGTTVYVMIQLAVYMGIQEIYLLGIDNSYAVTDENEKDYSTILDDGKKIIGGKIINNQVKYRTDLPVLDYLSALKYANEHNIKIYNATRGGKLEVFERKKLEDIL